MILEMTYTLRARAIVLKTIFSPEFPIRQIGESNTANRRLFGKSPREKAQCKFLYKYNRIREKSIGLSCDKKKSIIPFAGCQPCCASASAALGIRRGRKNLLKNSSQLKRKKNKETRCCSVQASLKDLSYELEWVNVTKQRETPNNLRFYSKGSCVYHA